MPHFKINQGIYWLKAHTSFSEEDLQFLLDRVNTDKTGEEGGILTSNEIRRFRPLKPQEREVAGLLKEWINSDYAVHSFSLPSHPSFLLVDDGDGYFEDKNSRDTFFVETTNGRGKKIWTVSSSPLSGSLPMNVFRLKEAYLRTAGRVDLFGFEDISALLENLQGAFGRDDLAEARNSDFQFVQQWFLSNRSSWVHPGNNSDSFDFKLAVSLLLEMGPMGGAGQVVDALNELTAGEWKILFRDPRFSLECLRLLSQIELASPSLAPIEPKSFAARLMFKAAEAANPNRRPTPAEWADTVDLFCSVLTRASTIPSAAFPGEILIALSGLRSLLANNSSPPVSVNLVHPMYDFISEFVSIDAENLASPSVPSNIPTGLFDAERWKKASIMDINLLVMREAFIVLETAGLDGLALRDQIDRATDEDKDPREPEDVLTAIFMILHSDLPEVKRSEAYVQFYKRVLARKMLAERKGDWELARSMEKLQTMNQIGRELERMFWGNEAFRENLLAGREENLNRRLRDNLDSSDLILSRNFLPLAVMQYLYSTYAGDEKEGRQVWLNLDDKMKSGEINLGFVVQNRLEHLGYEDHDREGFIAFVEAGQISTPPAYAEILRWCEKKESELPFSVFFQMLNDTEMHSYIIDGKEARSQALSAIFTLRSWSSGIYGRVENYFGYLNNREDPDKFTVTERLAFLEGLRRSDLRHLLPQYLFAFFKDPNELVREKAFEIYEGLGYPSAIARNYLGIFFKFTPEERRRPDSFMAALQLVRLSTERDGEMRMMPIGEALRQIIGRLVGFGSTENATWRFIQKKRRFDIEPISFPSHAPPRRALFVNGDRLERRMERLLYPNPKTPFAYRRLSRSLVASGDRHVIPVMIDALLTDAPVEIGDRPLAVIMPALDFVAGLFGIGDREEIEKGLVGTISHNDKNGPLTSALPGLLLRWGRRNHIDVVQAFRRAIFKYDAGTNLEIQEKELRLREEKAKDVFVQDADLIDALESDLIELYAGELRRRGDPPGVLDQLIAGLYNEVRREYLIDQLKRYRIAALEELTRRIDILTKKIGDDSRSAPAREKNQIEREKLLEVLLAIQ